MHSCLLHQNFWWDTVGRSLTHVGKFMQWQPFIPQRIKIKKKLASSHFRNTPVHCLLQSPISLCLFLKVDLWVSRITFDTNMFKW